MVPFAGPKEKYGAVCWYKGSVWYGVLVLRERVAVPAGAAGADAGEPQDGAHEGGCGRREGGLCRLCARNQMQIKRGALQPQRRLYQSVVYRL
eukprot:551778-Rhodomonas_salina.1